MQTFYIWFCANFKRNHVVIQSSLWIWIFTSEICVSSTQDTPYSLVRVALSPMFPTETLRWLRVALTMRHRVEKVANATEWNGTYIHWQRRAEQMHRLQVTGMGTGFRRHLSDSCLLHMVSWCWYKLAYWGKAQQSEYFLIPLPCRHRYSVSLVCFCRSSNMYAFIVTVFFLLYGVTIEADVSTFPFVAQTFLMLFEGECKSVGMLFA